jgi:diadenylate cyclase
LAIPRIGFTAVLDILAVAFVIYQLLLIVRGTRAAQILLGIVAVALVYQGAVYAQLEALRSMLSSLAPYSAIAIIVLFQSEIRRTLARLGRRRLFGGYQRPESTDEILLALASLSRDKVGALIVLERDIGLRTFIESGVPLDSRISRDLLLSIFLPGTALHDGAVIVQKDRIAAAACFLPLTVNPALSAKMGTRHRAGIGITEETDCLALIVSEETGAISIAASGLLERNVTVERVDERINTHFEVSRKNATASAPIGPPPETVMEAQGPPETAQELGGTTRSAAIQDAALPDPRQWPGSHDVRVSPEHGRDDVETTTRVQ